MSHEINEEKIEHLARLAKIKLSAEEIKNTIPHIEKVLRHFDELSSLNTDNIEPLITPVDIDLYFREDVVEKNIETKTLVDLSSDKMGLLYKVPPAIG